MITVTDYLKKYRKNRIHPERQECCIPQDILRGQEVQKYLISEINAGIYEFLQDHSRISKKFIVDLMNEVAERTCLEFEIGEPDKCNSDGSTAEYYQLPENANELQELINHKNMNANIGEIFRTAYRYGSASHSDQLIDARKIKYYIDWEIKRLEGA